MTDPQHPTDDPTTPAPASDAHGPALEAAPEAASGDAVAPDAVASEVVDPVKAEPVGVADAGSLSAPPVTGAAPVAGRGQRRVLAAAGAAWLALAGVAGLVGYEAGRAEWSPPAHVTVVDGARDNAGFAAGVYRAAHASVVEIMVDGGGTGTGFFYGPNRIVTNAHVVASSATTLAALGKGEHPDVQLRLADGRLRTGKVLAVDTRLDVAIVATEPGLGVAPLAFKSGTETTPGAPVAVLGHPFGGQQMMTTGIFSGYVTNSQFAESDVQSLLLQTDAAVNPGNSGGPLLDASGAVLGLITLRPDEVNGRQTAGLALAIPGQQVRVALEQLERGEQVGYPVIGVQLSDASVADQGTVGATVEDVRAGSGAAAAGVRPGEVIVRVDDQPVTSAQDVVAHLMGDQPGDHVTLTLAHGDAGTRTVDVTLGSR